MLIIISIPLLFALFLIAVQDFRQRAISWWLIPLGLLGSLVRLPLLTDWTFAIHDGIYNLTFVFFILLLVSLYYSIKQGCFQNIVNQQLGIGDLLFFLICTISFSFPFFVLFFIAGLITNLLGTILLMGIKRSQSVEIPLAGGMSVLFFILVVGQFIFPSLNFYKGDQLLSFFPGT